MVLLTALGLLSGAAEISRAAGPARVRLSVGFAEAARCPPAAVFEAAVVARLGYDPRREAAELSAEVTIRRSGRRLGGVIALFGPGGEAMGERRVAGRAGRCAALVETLALALSMALDADAVSRPHGPRRPLDRTASAASRQDCEPTPAPAAPPELEPPAPERALGSRELDGGLRIGFGEAPSVSTGLMAGLRFARGAFVGGLELAGAWPAGRDVGGGRIRVSTLQAAFVPCGRIGWFRLCGVARAGLAFAAGQGLDSARRGVAPTAALGARLSLHLPIHRRLALAVHAELAAALLRTRLRVDADVAWTTPRLGGAAGVALSWRLP
ncbi:MAG: hypothetical protein R3F39_25305 [Myxococcota bacterium]